MMVDNFAARCCFHYITASIMMPSKIITEHCFVKAMTIEEKIMLQNT